VYAAEVERSDEIADPSAASSDVYWFVGASVGRDTDQSERFFAEGIWEINEPNERDQELVRSMRVGERIAIKSTYVRKHGLPFESGGRVHSVMAVKAVGTITANPADGHRVDVDWTPLPHPREWYFYTYQPTIWRVTPDKPERAALVRFAFEGEPQDFDFWARAWRAPAEGEELSATSSDIEPASAVDEAEPGGERPYPTYGISDLIDEGAFLSAERIREILALLERKKNIVLQGPPGTGKTWLARKLGFALVGRRDPSRVTSVQFQPSYSYEDFVRGYRPHGDGTLQLVDGLFLQLAALARRTPGPVVLVIEEINRGDPAQVFGELLTLLEESQRDGEGVRLAYGPGGNFSVPANLYVIGTMNLADRSLALVDFALRRRFGFVDLKPELGDAWRDWCEKLGAPQGFLSTVAERIETLNTAIAEARGLGDQFRIGHSYVTPAKSQGSDEASWTAWWRSVVTDELGPLLAEYWHEEPETAVDLRDRLLDGS
jgi:5-methylcytosine-specific restriction protein B